MSIDHNAIREALSILRSSLDKVTVFASDSHKFVMNPVASGTQIAEFESQHGVQLPRDYRDFLLHVGNGGAGPCYGVFALGEMDDGWGQASWDSESVGNLAQPFPHSEPWNDQEGAPVYDQNNVEEYDHLLIEFEKKYYSTELVNGAIPICHRGCAYRYWLVVTGQERGNIW